MKEKIKILLISCILIFFIIISIALLTGCEKKLKSNDLSNIYLDNMTIGTEIDSNDLSKYTSSNRYSGNYKYKFEEIIIDTDDDNKINYLFAKFIGNHIDIKVNDREVNTIDDIKNFRE